MQRAAMLSRLVTLVLLAVPLAGCEVVGGIFKAGFWVGAVAVIVIVLVLVFVVGKFRS
jgi:hypothetical protein